MSVNTCPWVLNLAGRHFRCVEEAGHSWVVPHRNPEAQAIWAGWRTEDESDG